MSKKRTSPESSNDEQTNDGSDSVFQQADNAKRAKLTLSDTTLQDLPMELIECILVKAVAMEVMGMTRVNSAWKQKADPVINRLRTVCSQWSNILTTDFFRNELHRTFEAEKTIRLEILHESPLNDFVCRAITFKDELFLLCVLPQGEDYFAIHVYDRNNVDDVKDVIPLPGVEPRGFEACSVSNCLYLLNNKAHHLSVLRITKTYEHQFNVSPLISGLRRRYETLSVAANGNLFLSWQKNSEHRAVISVYGPNGSLQYETRLTSDIYQFFFKIIPKSNGNFIMVSFNDQMQTNLTEIDMDGTMLRQYQSSLIAYNSVFHAYRYERIMITDLRHRFELLDSEFNLLEVTGPQLDGNQETYCGRTCYNRERNEVATVYERDDSLFGVLAIFHFT